jgi:hypothetical protein
VALLDAVRRIHRDQVVLNLIDRGGALPFTRFGPGTTFDFRTSRMIAVDRSAGLRSLDLIMDGQGDAAAAGLFNRVKILRAFGPEGDGFLDAWKSLSIREVAMDVGILVAQTKPSDKHLADLDGVLASTFTDELARSIRGQTLRYYEQIPALSRSSRWTGSARLVLRPMIRHHFVANLQTAADALQAARLPWPERIEAMNRLPERRSILPEVPWGIGAWRRNEDLRNQTVVLGEGLAAMRCARLVIKVEKFRRANDRLPDALSELTLAAGDEVALDPFTGKRLLYARDSEAYVVYSVGRNSRDDGGKLWPEPPPPGRLPSTLRPPDVGVRVVLNRK